MTRIGVFGGTFNPPHIAHLVIAEWVREALELECVLWIPAADQPLKSHQAVVSVHHRIEMVRRSISSNPTFELSLVDVDRPGPHYTVDTLDILSGQMPNIALTLVVGSDSLRDFPRWHKPDRLLDRANLAVVDRPGVTYDLERLTQGIPGLLQAINWVTVPAINVSATDIRRRCANHQSLRYLVVPTVADYIEAHGLYRESVG